ncbi:MAG: hypothetical protein E7254_06390 [Lachnospiraceae bacterium]|nr:hypothetical protein [Lachnospiraceae bacterium]
MIQKNYKDKLFNYMFGREERKDYLLSLYNALNDKEYTNLDDLTIYTIEDAIYIGYKNDVSCLVASDEVLSLYEQQSTYNPNMPIRGIFYFSELYQKYIKTNKLNMYGSSLIKLPTPEYYVFYIGKKNVPERVELKLSDMFNDDTGVLECTATMININIGNNVKLIQKCKPLHDYSTFINRVYHYQEIYDTIEEAIDKAVNSCIKDGILSDLLSAHKAEVSKMLLTEFNEEEYIDMVKAEGIEIGKTEGIEIGKTEGVEIGKKKMILELISDGIITPEQGAERLGVSLEELNK